MANFDSPSLGKQTPHSGTWGNAVELPMDSVGTDNTAANIGDVIRIGVVPAGTVMTDILARIADGPASATVKCGWAYVGGETDDDSESADDNYFFTEANGAYSSGPVLLRKTAANLPKYLKYDAFITLTLVGADHTADVAMQAIVKGYFKGLE